MNYRHAFHAGNFADCMKHALLLWLVRAMQRKAAGFLSLDTHAGLGRYDLSGEEARRTGEWQGGIGRLLAAPPDPALADYLGLVGQLGLYPGSPAFIAACLRPQDRLVCCELHPEDHAVLRATFRGNRQVAVHLRDGYEAIGAFLPPPEKRAFVLIDPPFEQGNEFGRLVSVLQQACAKFPSAVIAVWYPIKHRAPVRAFHQAVADGDIRDVVAAELLLREPVAPDRLNGSGLLVVNPPWRFEEEAPALLAALVAQLAQGAPGSGFHLHRLAAE
ncbi:23S rRNA (adenine(2030)-N(6))-methyltransferase RlmJ [Acidisoma sp. 7E03]